MPCGLLSLHPIVLSSYRILVTPYNRLHLHPPQGLGKALLELRSEMTALAEQQIISSAAQREESLNVQTLVDKHTKELKVSEKTCPPPEHKGHRTCGASCWMRLVSVKESSYFLYKR